MIGSVRHILTNTIDLGVMALFRAVLSQKDVSWWAGVEKKAKPLWDRR